MDRKGILLLGLILFLNLFFFRPSGSLTFILQSLGILVFLIGIFLKPTLFKTQKLTIVTFTAAFALTALILIIRANPTVHFILSFYIFYLLFLLIYLFSTRITFIRSLAEGLFSPLIVLSSYFQTAKDFLRKKYWQGLNKNSSSSPLLSLGIGLLFGIPVTAVLLLILINADPIFAKFVKDLFSQDFFVILAKRLFYSIFLALLFLPLLYLKRKNLFISPFVKLERLSLINEMSVVMTLVGLTMASFLTIQWSYVFANVAAETDLSRFGVATYSEYVRKGFIELLLAAVLIYSLIWLGLIFLRGRKTTLKSILPILQMIVLGEFAVFIISIFRRIWLYQLYHGWSLIRIYGGFFLLWLAGITLTLTLRHFYQRRWVLAEAGFSLTIILIFGLFNAEQFIVTHHPPTVNNRLDYVYLSRMSPDGYAGWEKAYQYAEDILLKSNFDKKNLLDKEDRRQIAYAGIITGQLTHNYHRLLNQYGNPKEIQLYYQAVLEFEYKTNNYYHQEIDKFQSTAQSAPNTPVIESLEIRPEQFNPRGGKMVSSPLPPIGLDKQAKQDLQKALEKEQQYLKDQLKKIKNNEIETGKIAAEIYLLPNQNRIVFKDSLWGYNPFYQVINPDDKIFNQEHFYRETLAYKKRSALDIIFNWHFGKIRTYQSVRDKIGFQKLFILQEQFIRLYQKITQQPVDERDYQSDISFNTPFLGSW